MSSLSGLVGEVTVRIPGGERPGEVRVRRLDMLETYIAYSRYEMVVGTPALVINQRSVQEVNVEPWDLAGPAD